MTPLIAKSQQLLSQVKTIMINKPGVELIEQVPYREAPKSLPSLQTLSFLLYRENNEYKVAKTSNAMIIPLSFEEFEAMNNFSPDSGLAHAALCEKLIELKNHNVKAQIKL